VAFSIIVVGNQVEYELRADIVFAVAE